MGPLATDGVEAALDGGTRRWGIGLAGGVGVALMSGCTEPERPITGAGVVTEGVETTSLLLLPPILPAAAVAPLPLLLVLVFALFFAPVPALLFVAVCG